MKTILTIVLLLIAAIAHATTVTLSWDKVTDPTVTGYKVHYQVDSAAPPFTGSGAAQGSSPIDVKNVTTATISGLPSARSYSFAVTAYNAQGMESAYSNIVTVPAFPPSPANVKFIAISQ